MAHLTIASEVWGEAFVVAVQSPTCGDPGQCALDDPASRQDLKAMLAFGLSHDLQSDSCGRLGPLDELAGVPAVGPHMRDGRVGLCQRGEDQAPAVTVSD